MLPYIDEFHIAHWKGKAPENMPYQFHEVERRLSWWKRGHTLKWIVSISGMVAKLIKIPVELYYTLSGYWIQELVNRLSKKTKKPYVVRLRGDHRESRNSANINRIKKWYWNYHETRTLKEADLIIPICEKLRQKAISWEVDPNIITEPVPLGVDPRLFKPMKPKYLADKFCLGYVGRLSPEKGIKEFLNFARMTPELDFLVAGDRQTEVTFPGNVRYLGRVLKKDVPMMMNSCDIIALPSHTEGFPNVLLEAYACEKPVLLTPEAYPEETKLFGICAPVQQWTEAVKELGTWDLKSLGRKARAYVRDRYTWKHYVERMVTYLGRVAR